SVTYDGNSHTAAAAATGVQGEDLSSLLNLSGTTHTGAGSYTTDTWSFAGNNNYNSAQGTVDDEIARAKPTFAVVATKVTTDGAPSATLSGSLSSGALVPTGSVTVTLDGVPTMATIGANGSFSATFATGSLSVGTHTITFTYAGDQNFTDASAAGSLDDTY